MPSGYGDAFEVPVNGIWPVTKSQPSASTAWLNVATGSGAPWIMLKIGSVMPAAEARRLRHNGHSMKPAAVTRERLADLAELEFEASFVRELPADPVLINFFFFKQKTAYEM